MEEQEECDKIGNRNNRFYFVKFPTSTEEQEKEEARKQYELMNLARLYIDEEINQQRAHEYRINKKLMRFSNLDEQIIQKMGDIKYTEKFDQGLVEPSLPIKTIPGRTSYLHFPWKDSLTLRPDRKRCQKSLIKKGQINMEYLQETQEELLFSKKSVGMTSSGTQELDELIESLSQRIRHGNKKRADDMKIYHEIRNITRTREMYTAPEPKRDTFSIYAYSRACKPYKYKRIKILLDEIEKIKRDQRKARVARLKADLERVRKNINLLTKKLENVNSKIEAYKHARKLSDELEEMVEGFMKSWSESKAFKDDYERRKRVLERWSM